MVRYESPDFASNALYYSSTDVDADIFSPDSEDRWEIGRVVADYQKQTREEMLQNAISTPLNVDIDSPAQFIQAFNLPLAPAMSIDGVMQDSGRDGTVLAYVDENTGILMLGPKAVGRDDAIVHEFAHGTGLRSYTVKVRNNQVDTITSVRRGFSEGSNVFLEEGFADLMRGMYNSVTHQEGNSEFEALPPRYIKEVDGQIAHSPWSDAGFTLELLAEKDPSIMNNLFEARVSIDGLRVLAQSINRLSPGLYTDLKHTPYIVNANTFAKVRNATAERLFGKKADRVIAGMQQSSNATRFADDMLARAGVSW